MIRYLRSKEGEGRARALAILGDYLLSWTRKHPTDFAAPGAIPPLEKLIRSVDYEL
jgi:hypothetical protein